MAERSKVAVKRKRTVLTIEKKVEILDKLKKNSCSSLAKEYGIRISTVCELKKNEEKIRSFFVSMDSQTVAKKRNSMKNANGVQLDKAWLVNFAHSFS